MLEAEINITGRVQGVGFRPFIYRKAVKNGLKGYVINLGDAGVEIRVEGTEESIKQFLDEIKKDAPNVSDIKNVVVEYKPYLKKFKKFRIEKSRGSQKSVSGIYPPDIGICEECINDMVKKGSRWFNYPFTACAWCGPRFTGIKALPYDRERTHMNKFSLCNHCSDEYFDPIDRRFDAQGITCSICGPKMTLYDSNTSKINTKSVFSKAARMLKEGKILAIKGIGGVHLSTLSTNDSIIEELRIRKNRPNQPFALMSPDIKKIREIAYLNSKEETIISSWRKPIILLKKKEGILSELVAPGLDTVGIMLPYSGIHKMIFKNLKEPALIMTSGNKSGLPMAISNKNVFLELQGIADAFLLHNRKIINRCDDSILRIISGRKAFIRRSRGYVPDPIKIPFKNVHSISVGAELSNTGAVCNDGKCYPTQYIGDITNLESYEYEKNAIKTLRNLLNITCNPDVIGCDLHPDYMTSQMANEISQETETQIVTSQHHHAHTVSASVENEIDPDDYVIGIAMDGVGYGTDGAIWGGEVIISTFTDFKRIGHLEYLPMPGGDLNTKYPVRMLISALSKIISKQEICDITHNHIKNGLRYGMEELELLLKQTRNPNTIKTSSSGRFLDSIAALTQICLNRTYEGEPAIKLEAAASRGDPEKIEIKPIIEKINGYYVLKTSNILYKLLKLVNKNNIYDIAAFGQKYITKGLLEIAIDTANSNSIEKIVVSGGVLINSYISSEIQKTLKNKGLIPIFQKNLPSGDGGISTGQAMISIANVI